MKIPKGKEPKIKDLAHINTEWHNEKDMYTRISVYNKKVKVIEKPKGDDALTNEQFNQIMNRFDGIETDIKEVKDDVQTLKVDVKTLKGDVSTLKEDILVLKGDVKTLNNRITNLVDKNALVE